MLLDVLRNGIEPNDVLWCSNLIGLLDPPDDGIHAGQERSDIIALLDALAQSHRDAQHQRSKNVFSRLPATGDCIGLSGTRSAAFSGLRVITLM